MERIPIKSHPALFDRVIGYVQTGLADNLPWLNFAFGKAERLVKNYNGKRVYSPNLYVGKNEYELITPDSGIGNYCFFTLDEPEDVSWEVGDRTQVEAPFSLIVWVDMRTLETDDERNTEAIKQDILRTLNGKLWMKEGRIRIDKVWEKAENIFKGFTLDEVDNQFLMQPYCGWRFEGVLEAFTDCEEVIPPTPPVEPQYIRGHFTDGRTSFTFNVNRYESITVDVDKNGWWKWDVDRTITSLWGCCSGESITILDYVEMVGVNLNNITSYYFAFGQDVIETDGQRIIDMSKCKGAITSLTNYFAARARCLWYMPNLEIWGNNVTLQAQSRIIAKGYIKTNMGIGNLNNLLKNNVLSIIQAAQANVTYTLHSTIYAKCASGGEWHSDIQAAIDTKSTQGYVVTLISA